MGEVIQGGGRCISVKYQASARINRRSPRRGDRAAHPAGLSVTVKSDGKTTTSNFCRGKCRTIRVRKSLGVRDREDGSYYVRPHPVFAVGDHQYVAIPFDERSGIRNCHHSGGPQYSAQIQLQACRRVPLVLHSTGVDLTLPRLPS